MTTPYPEALSQALDHPDVKVETTTDSPDGQCEWCQMVGALCAVSVEWLPRPDVLSDESTEACLDCAASRVRWAVDDALDGSVVRVEVAGGAAA
ncbi:hypothetical protein SAMN05421805_12765 [Saccharopolyspora antimicrobica]|uniref:Uncharacterized protein n=1 Tax=Saccharopolyspora antimicrobica TaxID=455193 RepID=A0A1I5KL17_9PSEU|nr:hypothetical protein [Saccharopolyspora antimicrobica]RKT85632.1 hypothetical protein ATL45_3979 [Saccharopolyspora antimicrobica]SFO85719.1 hypothetical protein SAMN05421805_12765 [Saccharopolyspora antimicrobica]